jgi:heme A synthase
MNISRIAKYSWGVLFYNLIVILWGVYVRASGSGAGCGSHWPLCNGEIIPQTPRVETIIEFTHRIMSGLSFFLVLGLFIWAWRKFPNGHIVRKGVAFSLFFIVTEALVGAGLVLFEWVANDASLGRAISMAVHLLNTFLLLASLTVTAWWVSTGDQIRVKTQGVILFGLGIGLVSVMVLGTTGAITALGDTLFPSGSLSQGFQQDFSPTANFLIRLRVWHPLFAIATGFYLIFVASLLAFLHEKQVVRRFAVILILLFFTQLVAGLLNLLLLAPVWMQLIHLLLADSLWIVLVLLTTVNLYASEYIPAVLEPQPSALKKSSSRIS